AARFFSSNSASCSRANIADRLLETSLQERRNSQARFRSEHLICCTSPKLHNNRNSSGSFLGSAGFSTCCIADFQSARLGLVRAPRSLAGQQAGTAGDTPPDTRAYAPGIGAPAATRTRDPLLRRQMLYPTELRALLTVCGTNAAQQQADFSPTADFNWTLRACDADRGKNSARIDTLTI